MTSETRSQFPQPRIDARALLGLYDPQDGADWGPIRAAQINAAGQLALMMLGASLTATTLVMLLFSEIRPLWQLVTWGAISAAVALAVVFRRVTVRSAAANVATLSHVRDTVLDGAALAAVWSVPPLAFTPGVGIDHIFGLWMILAVLMAAAALAMASLPLATILFLGVVGLASAVMLFFSAPVALAATSLVFTLLLMVACFSRGRALVVLRANELALGERDETVSLLLGEFEDNVGDWLWEIDAQRRVLRASPRFARSIGVDPAKINGTSLLEILAGPSWQSGNFPNGLRVLAEKLKGRESFRDLLLPVHVDGQERWWEMTASPRFDDATGFLGFRGVGSDVTEARASADKINRMARYDTLTGLPNRLLVHEALARAMADAEKWRSRCAFMMIDLDRFKAINDTLGHPVGDRLLGRVSERLGQLMTDNEMIGRLGGDEFAVVVRDATDTAAIERLALRIIDTLSTPYEVDRHTLYIGASIGIAYGPRDGRTAETLIRSADLALYRSKDAGGGVFHTYDPQLHVQAEERRVLELALRSALANHELMLHYQPVVDTDSGRLNGFEALLRWCHPEYGMVSPAKFIPLAEEARLIGPIGDWVLQQACFEAARWTTPLRIAVNVSSEQLLGPAFVGTIEAALRDSGLPADRLEIEVTESVFAREGTCAARTLEKIIDLGINLSLDDFGTGYSSLGYLSRTRFSTIKIDRSFVQSAAKGEKEAIAIIRAVVALAQSLDMATTAEGVETEEEHQLVQALGCSKVQGYYFGRPLPALEARALANPAGGGEDRAIAAA